MRVLVKDKVFSIGPNCICYVFDPEQECLNHESLLNMIKPTDSYYKKTNKAATNTTHIHIFVSNISKESVDNADADYYNRINELNAFISEVRNSTMEHSGNIHTRVIMHFININHLRLYRTLCDYPIDNVCRLVVGCDPISEKGCSGKKYKFKYAKHVCCIKNNVKIIDIKWYSHCPVEAYY